MLTVHKYYILARWNNLLKVDGGKTIINEWIHYVGGKNAITTKGSQITVTMEGR